MIPERIVNSLYCSLANEKHILEMPGLSFVLICCIMIYLMTYLFS